MDIDHNNFHKIAREVYLKAVQKKYPDFELIEAPPGNPPMSENWTTNSPSGQRSPLSATLELFSTPPPIEQNPNSDKFSKLFTCIKNLRSFFEERLEKVAEELLFQNQEMPFRAQANEIDIWKKDAMRFLVE